MTIRGSLQPGQQMVISCDAGDAKAVLVNAVLRPIVAKLSPVNLDDTDAILDLKKSYDWSALSHWTPETALESGSTDRTSAEAKAK